MKPALLMASILVLALSGCTGNGGSATQSPQPNATDGNAAPQVATLPEIRFYELSKG